MHSLSYIADPVKYTVNSHGLLSESSPFIVEWVFCGEEIGVSVAHTFIAYPEHV